MEPSNDLEQEFKDVFNKHHKEIQDKIDQALILIFEAQNLSNEYGLPFKFRLDKIRCYIPLNIEDKFPGLDYAYWEELVGEGPRQFSEDHESFAVGWQVSTMMCW